MLGILVPDLQETGNLKALLGFPHEVCAIVPRADFPVRRRVSRWRPTTAGSALAGSGAAGRGGLDF